MNKRTLFYALFCMVVPLVQAQNLPVEQFKRDQVLQDSVIAAIIQNHSIMSKLVDKVAENRQLHEMLIQHLTRLLHETSGASGAHDHASHETMSGYVGDEQREIKALSATEVKALLNGEGVGLAMAAELNHYPGPRHVLDLGDKLHLTEIQKQSAGESFDRMHARAIELGRQLVEKERALDKAFASNTISLKTLQQMTKDVEEMRGQLRYEHLASHVKMKNILTKEQVESYDRFRGYSTAR